MTNAVHDGLTIDELEEGIEQENKSPLAEKSMEELISMNEAAQKQISRQGNEIGELRTLTDDILRKQLESTPPKKAESEADWDYNPKEATEQLVNSKVDAIEAKMEEDRSQRALASFAEKHPNYKETAQSDKFREWVADSTYRAHMYDSGNAGDLLAADELFSEWERTNPTEEKPDNVSERDEKLKAAKMETGNGAPTTKKIYRRAELRKLHLRDPEAYEARQEEFSLAYKEGRVR